MSPLPRLSMKKRTMLGGRSAVGAAEERATDRKGVRSGSSCISRCCFGEASLAEATAAMEVSAECASANNTPLPGIPEQLELILEHPLLNPFSQERDHEKHE